MVVCFISWLHRVAQRMNDVTKARILFMLWPIITLEITQVCCPGHLVTLSHSLSHSHAGLTSRRSRRPDSDWDRSLDPTLDRGPGPGRWLEECRDSNCGFIDKWILQQRGSCVYLNVQWLTFIPRTITVTAFPQIDTSPRGLYVKYSAESSGFCQTSGMLGA